MADTNISPNMNLPIPQVGVDPGPDWALNINSSLTLIDNHNHSAGYGVQINPAGININSDLPFNGNDATILRSTRFQLQSAPITGAAPDLACLYASGVDLYFNDANGNQIQITSNGGIAGSPGSISNLTSPASASYVAANSTFVWQSAANTAATMDMRSIILRNSSANSKGLTLNPPAAMGANYSLTLPSLPGTQSFMTLDAAGNMSAPWTVDNSTIKIVSNHLAVQGAATAAIVAPSLVDNVTLQQSAGVMSTRHNYITHQFNLNGNYGQLSFPLTEIDGFLFFNYNATILAVWIYNVNGGASGTTEFDLKLATAPGGAFSSILSTTGTINSSAGNNVYTDSNSVIGALTGVRKPVLSSSSVNAGSVLRWDLLQSQDATASDCGVIIQFVPR